MQSIPKIDLHIHLGGSFPFSYLESVGDPADVTALSSFLDHMERKDCTDYHVCFQAFALVGKIMNSLKRIEDGTAALCREMAADGVHYVEMRTGLKNFSGTGHGYEEYVKAFLRGVQSGTEGSSLQVRWLLSLKRDSSKGLLLADFINLLKYGFGFNCKL
jgi:adenosine deaminase